MVTLRLEEPHPGKLKRDKLMDNSLKLLVFLNIADIFLTKRLTDQGAVELNPVMEYLLAVNFWLALVFKLAIVGLVVIAVMELRKHSKGINFIVTGANLFFTLLVIYQVIGLFVLY